MSNINNTNWHLVLVYLILINSYETKKFMPSQKMRKTLKEKKINLEKLAF